MWACRATCCYLWPLAGTPNPLQIRAEQEAKKGEEEESEEEEMEGTEVAQQRQVGGPRGQPLQLNVQALHCSGVDVACGHATALGRMGCASWLGGDCLLD